MHMDSQRGSELANSGYRIGATRNSAYRAARSTSAQFARGGGHPHGWPRIATPQSAQDQRYAMSGGHPHGWPRIATPIGVSYLRCRMRWRSPSRVAEDRNFSGGNRYRLDRASWRSPSRVAEDRNAPVCPGSAVCNEWRSPSRVAEDRNLDLRLGQAKIVAVAVTLTGGRGSQHRQVVARRRFSSRVAVTLTGDRGSQARKSPHLLGGGVQFRGGHLA